MSCKLKTEAGTKRFLTEKLLQISGMTDRYDFQAKLLKKHMIGFLCCFQWFWSYNTDVSGKKKYLNSFLPLCWQHFAFFFGLCGNPDSSQFHTILKAKFIDGFL